MKQILDENNNILFEGTDYEMELAYQYLTTPFHILAERKGLRMKDAYVLCAKYRNDKTRNVKSFRIVCVPHK